MNLKRTQKNNITKNLVFQFFFNLAQGTVFLKGLRYSALNFLSLLYAKCYQKFFDEDYTKSVFFKLFTKVHCRRIFLTLKILHKGFDKKVDGRIQEAF